MLKLKKSRGRSTVPKTKKQKHKSPSDSPPSSSSSSSSSSRMPSLHSDSSGSIKGKKDKGEDKKSEKKDKKKKKKRKESSSASADGKVDKLTLLAYPSAAQFRQWRQSLRLEVVACSKLSRRKTLKWIHQVESSSATFESLAKSGKGFSGLDVKLASALTKLFKGEVAREISTRAEKAMQESGSLLTGRQLLYIMYLEFAEDLRRTTPHAISDLSKLVCKNSAGLEHWLNSFRAIIELNTGLQTDLINYHVYEQLKEVDALKIDVQYYQRLDEDDPNKTYRFFVKAIKRYLQDKRQEQQRKEIQVLYNQVPGPQPSLIAAQSPAETPATQVASKKVKKQKDPATALAVPATNNLCEFFAKHGKCGYGDKCKFAHISDKGGASRSGSAKGSGNDTKGKFKGKRGHTPPPKRESSPGRTDEDRSKIPCRCHSKGTCAKGSACPFKHVAAVAKAAAVAIIASSITGASGLPIMALACVLGSCIRDPDSNSTKACLGSSTIR